MPTATDSANNVPATMRAWVFDTAKGGIDKTMKLEPAYPVPASFQKLSDKDAILVRVLFASVNPVDYKLPELPLVGAFLQRKPTTPGADFCGRVVAATAPGFQPGQLVAGKTGDMPEQHGTLAEYVVAHSSGCVVVPEGVAPQQAAAATGICGPTAWSASVPHIQKLKADGQTTPRVFVNGGSGGVGTLAVQIAKAFGCHVTATCSTPNVQFLRDLGADDVVDYRATRTSVADELVQRATNSAVAGEDRPRPFDLAVDTVGAPFSLYKAGDHYLAPSAKFVQVGITSLPEALRINFLPSFLGGGHRSAPFLAVKNNAGVMRQVLDLIAEGKVKVPIEEEIPFEDAPRAYTKLKTHHTRGKLVVKVANDN